MSTKQHNSFFDCLDIKHETIHDRMQIKQRSEVCFGGKFNKKLSHHTCMCFLSSTVRRSDTRNSKNFQSQDKAPFKTAFFIITNDLLTDDNIHFCLYTDYRPRRNSRGFHCRFLKLRLSLL